MKMDTVQFFSLYSAMHYKAVNLIFFQLCMDWNKNRSNSFTDTVYIFFPIMQLFKKSLLSQMHNPVFQPILTNYIWSPFASVGIPNVH